MVVLKLVNGDVNKMKYTTNELARKMNISYNMIIKIIRVIMPTKLVSGVHAVLDDKESKQVINAIVVRPFYRERIQTLNDATLKELGIEEVKVKLSLELEELAKDRESEDEDKLPSRDSLGDIKKKANNKTKRYFVTGAVANAYADREFLESINTYCKENNAELVILAMRGVRSKYNEYDISLRNLIDSNFVTEFKFNSNLVAYDFMLNPQMINPLTGIIRFGQKSHSVIVASPKQQYTTIPSANGEYPHIVLSTGVITEPSYLPSRQGRLANQDHIKGGLIVEVVDNDRYHVRHIQVDDKHGFYDLDKYYIGNEVRDVKVSGIVMGDYHVGDHDPEVIANWKEVVDLLEPKYLVWHDIFNGASINHHIYRDINAKAKVPEDRNVLGNELLMVANELQSWTSTYPKLKHIIVKSNHDEWLEQYLSTGLYVNDPFNYRLSLSLATDLYDGKDPLESFVSGNLSKKDMNKIKFLSRTDSFKIEGIECGIHGDKGNNGARGSLNSAEISYGRSVTAHSHQSKILRSTWQVGTSTYLQLDYNKGGGSGWINSSCVIYPNGSRTFITSIDGEWRL